MKPRKFKPGDKVTEKDNKPFNDVGPAQINGQDRPLKFGEVYTVRTVDPIWQGLRMVTLEEFPETWGFDEDDLEKVVSDSVLEEELNSIRQPELV